MARPRRQSTPSNATKPVEAADLDRARRARAGGDIRTARRIARELAASASEAEKREALRILDQTRVDRVALLLAFAVLAAIALAGWLALLHAYRLH